MRERLGCEELHVLRGTQTQSKYLFMSPCMRGVICPCKYFNPAAVPVAISILCFEDNGFVPPFYGHVGIKYNVSKK